MAHITHNEAIDAVAQHDSIREAARKLNIPYTTFHGILNDPEKEYVHKPVKNPKIIRAPKTGVKRFIVTSAQDGTKPHKPFLKNLQAYAKHLGAEIFIAPFTYNKGLFEDHSTAGGFYHHDIREYLQYGRIHIANKIALVCEMNTNPTAVTPLSGLQAHTQGLWGVFPHPKIQVETVAQQKADGAKINYTTGAITLPNYVEKKAGLKAEFHHVIGALLIEVTKDKLFARHLLADENNGSFFDLDTHVKGGKIRAGQRVEGITWADIHLEKIEEQSADTCFFGENNILDTLKPRHQFFHDLTDFQARNHHNINDPHHLYSMYRNGAQTIAGEIVDCVEFLKKTQRKWCQSIVVESNHDQALLRWLKTDKGIKDPPNKRLYHELNLEALDAIDEDEYFNAFATACKIHGAPDNIKFLNEDEPYLIDSIAHFHGHRGLNGARGSLIAFAKMGRKSNSAHGHGGGIRDGAYQAGAMALDMGYNKGPSSWTITHIIQHSNGKRQLITLDKGEWRA